jgi:hypothetical protein
MLQIGRETLNKILQGDAQLLEESGAALEKNLETYIVRPICFVEDTKWFGAKVYAVGNRERGRKTVIHSDGSLNVFDSQELKRTGSEVVKINSYLALAQIQHDLHNYSISLSNRLDNIVLASKLPFPPFGDFVERLEKYIVELGGKVDYNNLFILNEIIRQKILIDKIEFLVEQRLTP